MKAPTLTLFVSLWVTLATAQTQPQDGPAASPPSRSTPDISRICGVVRHAELSKDSDGGPAIVILLSDDQSARRLVLGSNNGNVVAAAISLVMKRSGSHLCATGVLSEGQHMPVLVVKNDTDFRIDQLAEEDSPGPYSPTDFDALVGASVAFVLGDRREEPHIDYDRLTNSQAGTLSAVLSPILDHTKTHLQRAKPTTTETPPPARRNDLAQMALLAGLLRPQPTVTLQMPAPFALSPPLTTSPWIEGIDGNGAIIRLSDGSLWQVNELDRLQTPLWLPTQRVIVTDSGLFGEKLLVNEARAQSVRARRVR